MGKPAAVSNKDLYTSAHARTCLSPAWPPCSTPALMASRQSSGCVRCGARFCVSARANPSTATASPSGSSLSVLRCACPGHRRSHQELLKTPEASGRQPHIHLARSNGIVQKHCKIVTKHAIAIRKHTGSKVKPGIESCNAKCLVVHTPGKSQKLLMA